MENKLKQCIIDYILDLKQKGFSYNEIMKSVNKIFSQVKTTVEKANKELCCICGKRIEGFGNNAQPIADGRCCDDCNRAVINAKFDKIFSDGDAVNENV